MDVELNLGSEQKQSEEIKKIQKIEDVSSEEEEKMKLKKSQSHIT